MLNEGNKAIKVAIKDRQKQNSNRTGKRTDPINESKRKEIEGKRGREKWNKGRGTARMYMLN